jgi:two-component system, cell cycle sensor histidine kinase and response regulator CckA
MPTPLRVLFLEDRPADVELMLHELHRTGFEPVWQRVETEPEFLASLSAGYEVILSDYCRPSFDVLRALALLQAHGMDIPLIVVTGSISEEVAVECMKHGAADYLLKDRLARLGPAVAHALAQKQLRTERQHLEAQLRQAQKMEAVGRLAGGLAHDFNNLLTVLSTHSYLLLRGLHPGDPLYQYARRIQEAVERGTALTRQLLSFSHRHVLQPRVLDVNALLAKMTFMLRRLIGEHIALVTRLDPALGRITADPGQLEQVLLNLAINARSAMPQGGELTLETTNVELDGAYARQHLGVAPGPYVRLTVRDTGVGMTPEIQPHIFEPFFTTKAPGEGTGLGLAMVYGIVTQSGGHIAVDSAPGRGTTFTIYLPQTKAPTQAHASGPILTKPPCGGETIFVVEDEPEVRIAVREALRMSGYVVLEASDGSEALPISASHQGPIHLLLTDVVLPGMSGPELAQRLQSGRPALQVLYMSGYPHDAIASHGVVGSATLLLQKPFTPDVVARKVREILDAAPT